jgi:hypothetical protein
MDLKAGGSGVNVFDSMVTEAKKSGHWIPLLTLTKFSPTAAQWKEYLDAPSAFSGHELEAVKEQEGREKFPSKITLQKTYRYFYDWIEKYGVLRGAYSEKFLTNTIVSWVRHPNNDDKELILKPGKGTEPTTLDIVEAGRDGEAPVSILKAPYPIASNTDWRTLFAWPKEEQKDAFLAALVRLMCGIATAGGRPVNVRELFGPADNIPTKFSRVTSAFNRGIRLLAEGNLTPDLLRSRGGKMWDLNIPHIKIDGDAGLEKPQEQAPEDPNASPVAALRQEFENHKESYEKVVARLRQDIDLLKGQVKGLAEGTGNAAKSQPASGPKSKLAARGKGARGKK